MGLRGVVVRSLLLGVAFPSWAGAAFVGNPNIAAGNLIPVSNASAPGATVIGSGPATGDGLLNTVKFGWSASGGCAAVTLKVFRLDGANLDYVGERGPIAVTGNAGGGLTSAPISPTIGVEKGDLLGISSAGSCGGPTGFSFSPSPGVVVSFPSNVTSTVAVAAGSLTRDFNLALFASGTGDGETFAGIIAGAGSLKGASNANFKTGIQITNPAVTVLDARIVFHKAGSSAGANDPSLGFSIDPGATGSVDDVVAAVGLSGLWSIDLYTGHGDRTPIVIARIFSDAGAAGTTGFTEELVSPDTVPTGGEGILIGPSDLVRYRYQIGVRTIGGPVQISVVVRDHKGDVVHTSSQSYPANSFHQLTVHDFLGGFDVDVDESLDITFSGGGAIIYGATTDNVTNDPSAQFVRYFE
jgi:hypothetical protein